MTILGGLARLLLLLLVTQQAGAQQQCPAGTEAAYDDRALAWRFRPEGITLSANGSLSWAADFPLSGKGAGLAFSMTRPKDPGTQQDFWVYNATQPERVKPQGGRPGGVEFGTTDSADQVRCVRWPPHQ